MRNKEKHCKKNILALLEKNQQGIKLDIGAGENPQPGFVTMDIRALTNIDIVHDVESVPYPLPDGCCHTILASHLVEHICPKKFMPVMDEWWRLMKVGGQLWIGTPYGNSFGYVQDPTHCLALNEASWSYFDPTAQPNRELFNVYKPKPWKIVKNVFTFGGNCEVILEKMKEVPRAEETN